MSGHSKWATIKHKKGALDAKRGKLFTKLIKELTVAARMGGGDVSGNPRLRKAISDAKGQHMPADTIQRAVKRGTGELAGESIDEVVYEGTGPGGTLILVEAMTDNRNRTVAEIRKIFERNNGLLGGGGTAGWAFERKGQIEILKSAASEDQLMDLAIGAGADDYEDNGETWLVTTPPDALMRIVDAIEASKIAVKESSLAYLPKAKKPIEGREAEIALNLLEALDDHDDVQNVFADFVISDREAERIAALG